MNPLDLYQTCRKRLDALTREEGKLQGALEQLAHTLREDYECNTIAGARKLLQGKKKELKELGKKLAACERDFDDKWSEKLGGETCP